MNRIRIIVVDRTREPFLKEGERHYLERLRRYAKTEWIEVKPVKMQKGRSASEIMDLEADHITRQLHDRDYIVALDRHGKQRDSTELADWLQKIDAGSAKAVAFIIGGPLGISDKIRSRAREILSLSRATFTHEMTRLILLEQLYRAFTISAGEKYHK
jgi:23S rRNA (pseudouridine1915-N3)-methyltransferase